MKSPLGILLATVLATGPALAGWNAGGGEQERALSVKPDLENGRKLYRICALCHTPEGWGREDGSIPQISGQHFTVLVKQLADIRSRNRDTPTMYPYALPETIGGPSAIADVSAYIADLPMTTENGEGPGNEVDKGKELYEKYCVSCHGHQGEGNDETFSPRIGGQHYLYLVRQFRWIRDGKRRNANDEMVSQIQNFSEREVEAIMDYVSRMKPPETLTAPPGWKNMDLR